MLPLLHCFYKKIDSIIQITEFELTFLSCGLVIFLEFPGKFSGIPGSSEIVLMKTIHCFFLVNIFIFTKTRTHSCFICNCSISLTNNHQVPIMCQTRFQVQNSKSEQDNMKRQTETRRYVSIRSDKCYEERAWEGGWGKGPNL